MKRIGTKNGLVDGYQTNCYGKYIILIYYIMSKMYRGFSRSIGLLSKHKYNNINSLIDLENANNITGSQIKCKNITLKKLDQIKNKNVRHQIEKLCRLKRLHPSMATRTKGRTFKNNTNEINEIIWKATSDIVQQYVKDHDEKELYKNLQERLNNLHYGQKSMTLNQLIRQINEKLDMKIPLNSNSKSKSKR